MITGDKTNTGSFAALRMTLLRDETHMITGTA